MGHLENTPFIVWVQENNNYNGVYVFSLLYGSLKKMNE